MALEVVGGAFLSSFLAVLFDRMTSRPVFDFIRGHKNTAGLLTKLKTKLRSVQTLMDDAEAKQMGNQRVGEWLDELKDVLYRADDLLDDIKSEVQRRQLEEDSGSSGTVCQVPNFNSGSSSVQEFEKSLEPRILEILDSLEFIVNEKDGLNLKESVRDRGQERLPTTSLVKESGVYGRDEDKEKIIKLLLADDMTENKMSVIPIVGMGGIGKTTLAQLTYNDDQVKQHFSLKAWVCVSQDFDVVKITQTIYGLVTSTTCDMTDLEMLQVELKKALTGKKFLFVLDDVWVVSHEKWELLSQPFENGEHGSRIIVTTRNEGVASSIGTVQSQHIMILSDEDCWSLFKKHAFKNAAVAADPSHEKIGRLIAQKCKGLPLAAKSLGSLLCSEPNIEEWKEVLNNDVWELQDKENEILPALWLSYHYLPRHLKRCFAYCSIFPHDYRFEKTELVLLWMAEDLLHSNKRTRIEEVGEKCFDDLISRSFFQYSQKDSWEGIECFTMHDLMSDLAKFVSGQFCVRLENNDSALDTVSKSRHVSHHSKNQGFKEWDSLNKAQHLRTLLVREVGFCGNDLIFLNLQFLRVLKLSLTEVVPNSIGQLKHLRYLDLSDSSIEKLPHTVCTLYNLQTLLLRYCRDLTELPSDFGRLINLRHLDIEFTSIKKMPPRMGELKNLQTFRGEFVLDKDNSGELKELNQLRGTLRVLGLRNIVHVADAMKLEMRKRQYLKKLVLEWGGKSGDAEDSEKERQVLENMQPHTNLEELRILSYGGTRFPDWFEDHSILSNLVELQLRDCGNCWSLPAVHQLPSLRILLIKGFNGVGSNLCKPFPNLRDLYLFSCPNLTGTFSLDYFPKLDRLTLWSVNIECITVSQESNSPKLLSTVHGGPNLSTIEIWNCSKLTSLHSLLPSLTELEIYDCPELESFPEGGLPSQLQSLTIIGCKKLIGNRMQLGLPTLTSLQLLDISFGEDCEDSFPDEGLLPITLQRLDISSLKKLDGKGLRQLTSLKQLELFDCSKLQCLPDEGLPASLSRIDFTECGPVLQQRLQRETGEDWAKIAHIKDIKIDGKSI